MNEQKREGFRLDYFAEIPLKERERERQRVRESSCPLDYSEVLKESKTEKGSNDV